VRKGHPNGQRFEHEANAAPHVSLHGSERLSSSMRLHVVGAGPVGLLLTALLQSMEGVSVGLYEKRRDYSRTRMVTLAPYLVADSVESYAADAIDGDSVGAIFDPPELEQGIAFRQSILRI
jgi:threonine dehydrogenase-like Zn-dependent dehydrogenase